MRVVPGFVTAFALILLTAASLHAQVTETPVAFDSAGRVRVLTPGLVTRLGLTAPAWPVEGPFREARLFASNAGSVTLAVDRQSGAVDRYALSDSGRALRDAVNDGLSRTGALATETREATQSEQARPYFVKTQLALAWGLYGPLLGSLSDNGRTRTAIVLLSVPTSFFVVQRFSRRIDVTRSQANLAFDGALRGWGFGAGLLYVLAADSPDQKVYSAVGLGAALAGSVTGFKRGRSLTDGEAQAITTFSTMSALTGLGLLGTAHELNAGDERLAVGVALASGTLGYIIGPRYARQPGYSATSGDIQLVSLGAALGVLTALNAVSSDWMFNHGQQLVWGGLTTGLVGGAYVAHRVWVRPYENTFGDATLTGLGTIAGGLAGGGVVILAEPGFRESLAIVTAGAILGSVAGHRVANAPRAPLRRVSLDFTPSALGLAAARVPGRHAAITIRF